MVEKILRCVRDARELPKLNGSAEGAIEHFAEPAHARFNQRFAVVNTHSCARGILRFGHLAAHALFRIDDNRSGFRRLVRDGRDCWGELDAYVQLWRLDRLAGELPLFRFVISLQKGRVELDGPIVVHLLE